MPMNDLLAQHQLAQLKAREAGSSQERARFADLESLYAEKIEAWRAALGLPNEGWPGGSPQAD